MFHFLFIKLYEVSKCIKYISVNMNCFNSGTSSKVVKSDDQVARNTSPSPGFDMKCPHCHDVAIPPVYECLKGHMICSTCRKTINSCRLCKAAFNGTRTFFYESVFDSKTFPCKYNLEGCPEVVTGKLLKVHQENCNFRYE